MCDFGFAASVGKGDEDNLKDFCGTAMYISPEIAAGQKQSHGAAVDWWALGVVLCEMLTGDGWLCIPLLKRLENVTVC